MLGGHVPLGRRDSADAPRGIACWHPEVAEVGEDGPCHSIHRRSLGPTRISEHASGSGSTNNRHSILCHGCSTSQSYDRTRWRVCSTSAAAGRAVFGRHERHRPHAIPSFAGRDSCSRCDAWSGEAGSVDRCVLTREWREPTPFGVSTRHVHPVERCCTGGAHQRIHRRRLCGQHRRSLPTRDGSSLGGGCR